MSRFRFKLKILWYYIRSSFLKRLPDFIIAIIAVSIGGFLALKSNVSMETWNIKSNKTSDLTETHQEYKFMVQRIIDYKPNNSPSMTSLDSCRLELEKDMITLTVIGAGEFDTYSSIFDSIYNTISAQNSHWNMPDSARLKIQYYMDQADSMNILIRKDITKQKPFNIKKCCNKSIYHH